MPARHSTTSTPNALELARPLTQEEAAEFLSCSTWTIRRMISRGELKAYRYGGSRLIRIDLVDLQRLRKPVTNIGSYLGGDAA